MAFTLIYDQIMLRQTTGTIEESRYHAQSVFPHTNTLTSPIFKFVMAPRLSSLSLSLSSPCETRVSLCPSFDTRHCKQWSCHTSKHMACSRRLPPATRKQLFMSSARLHTKTEGHASTTKQSCIYLPMGPSCNIRPI